MRRIVIRPIDWVDLGSIWVGRFGESFVGHSPKTVAWMQQIGEAMAADVERQVKDGQG